MIEVQGKGHQVPHDSLPRAWFFPLPGLLYVLVGVLIVGILIMGVDFSGQAVGLIARRLEAGTFDDWHRPVHLLFFIWVGIVLAVGMLLTLAQLWNIGGRTRAYWAERAWMLYGQQSGNIASALRPDEEPLAYTSVDGTDLLAPALFERLFSLSLLATQAAVLFSLQMLVEMDGYQAFIFWMVFGPVSTLIVCGTMIYCRPSRTFVVLHMLWAPVFFRLHWKVDPVSSGPALGLPPFCLDLILLVMILATGLHVLRQRKAESLLVVTNRGLRRYQVSPDDASLREKADHPLVLVATPTAAGCRLQIGGSQGRERIRPVYMPGGGVLEPLQRLLSPHSDKLTAEGRDEPSGIAGRLGEVPLVGWLFLVLLVVVTQQTLLPPLIGRLQVRSVLDAYYLDMLRGQTRRLEESLERVLQANPSLGPAKVIRARILIENGQTQEAVRELEAFLRKREAWDDAPLVEQADQLLASLREG